MKRDSVNYVLVGVVVLAALVLLLATLAVVTGRGGDAERYHVHYGNVTGLSQGAPVFYEGFRVGQVDEIVPERSPAGTRYRVELAVRADWPIPADSVAQLVSSGLLADVSVGIREGSSREVLAPGSEIAGLEGADLFAAMNDLAGELTLLTRERIRPLVDQLGTQLEAIGGTLEQGAPELVAQATELLTRLNRSAQALEDTLGPENRAAIADVLANVRQVSGELAETRRQADALLLQLTETVEENRPQLREAAADLQHTIGALAQRIDAITHHLESSSRNLDEFSREIRRNPNRLLFTAPADEVQ